MSLRSIGARFWARRKSLGISRNTVADTGLISYTAYKRIELDKGPNSPTVWSLESIAQALGCRIEIRLVDERTGEEIE